MSQLFPHCEISINQQVTKAVCLNACAGIGFAIGMVYC